MQGGHAAFVRTWAIGGLAALALAIPAALAGEPAGALLIVAGIAYLALAVALGILPAFAQRDWPTPLYAIAALALAVLALPFLRDTRLFAALLGASLLLGAAQPIALLGSPRWATGGRPPVATDPPALAALIAALAATAGAGLALVALPRGLPNAAMALALAGGAPLAAFGALLFALPRQAAAPLPATTLAWASVAFLSLAAAGLAAAFAFPFELDPRSAIAAIAAGFGLATVALLRSPHRPRLLGSALALAVLATLALLLATIEPSLYPLAFHAFVALDLVLLAGALVVAARLLLPGRVRGERWMRFAPAFMIAALFLYTPALQLGRSGVPAALVGAAGLLWMLAGLAPLVRSR